MTRETDLAWAAGLFEGEGSISPTKSGWQLTLGTADRDVAERFHQVMGVGRLYGPYQPSTSRADGTPHKPFTRWGVTDKLGIEEAATLIGPELGERRTKRLGEALDALATQVVTRATRRWLPQPSKEDRPERWEKIREWWASGLTMKQIADALGWEYLQIKSEFTRMRRENALPHRYNMQSGKRVKSEEFALRGRS